MNFTGRPVFLTLFSDHLYPRAMRLLSLAFCACVVFLSGRVYAQNLDDALRLSEVSALGTARSLSVGNSMSALGADWTAAAANPAGLAAFRKTDFTITTAGIFAGSSGASLDGGPTSSSASTSRFAVPQVGLVFTKRPIASAWTQINFGLGVSQSARFEENLNYSGRSPGSISDKWLDDANQYGLDAQGNRAFVDGDFVFNPLTLAQLSDYSTGLAFDAGVLIPGDNTPTPPFYNTDYDLSRGDDFNAPGAPLTKTGSFERRGRNSAFDFTIAGNYAEKLMVGASLSLSRTEFRSSTSYSENDDELLVDAFERLSYQEPLNYSGTGVSGRIGLIYRAAQALRVGLSYQSPNRIKITDTYTNELTYIYRDATNATVNGIVSPEQASVVEYVYTSPSQYRASVAGLFGQIGFVTAELGYINFGGSKFKFEGEDDEAPINEVIDNSLQGAMQVRVGGEVKLKDFALRAGLQRLGGPIEGEKASNIFSGGVGYRLNRLSLDAAYQYTRRPDRSYSPYAVEPLNFPQPVVNYNPTLSVVALTLGWKLVSLE